jgi:hypothetical protein
MSEDKDEPMVQRKCQFTNFFPPEGYHSWTHYLIDKWTSGVISGPLDVIGDLQKATGVVDSVVRQMKINRADEPPEEPTFDLEICNACLVKIEHVQKNH